MTDNVPSGFVQTSDVEKRCAKLRAYFPPDCIAWHLPPGMALVTKPGESVTVQPYASALAITDRLDDALGPNNWRETCENPGDGSFTRCTLAVRFQPESDWVTRVGHSDNRDPDDAHGEAFREAALLLGVGRYLLTQVQAVPWGGADKGYTVQPKLPDHVLPLPYRQCGRERARVIRDILGAALAKAKESGYTLSDYEALKELVTRHGGYDKRPGIIAPDGVYLARVENRHADAITDQLNAWIADIAANRITTANAPVPEVKTAPEGKKEEKNNPPKKDAQPPAAQGNPAPAGK